MRFAKLFFTILACVFLSGVISQAQTSNKNSALSGSQKTKSCLSYEPEIVNLRGLVSRRIVVNASNQKENVWILKLDAPVCVKADPENEMNGKQNRVTDVQLVLDAEKYKKYRALLNKKIEASGTLFGAHTQHHFTDVLMIVGEVKAK